MSSNNKLFGFFASNGPLDRGSNNNNNSQKAKETLYYAEPIKKPTSGFKEDQLLVKDKYYLEKYKCLICQEFPFEPVECITVAGEGKSCGALFCKPCYEKYMSNSNNKTCPLRCSNKSLIVNTSFHFNDLINSNIKIRCQQCGETPDYSDYINHLEKCRSRQYICKACSVKGNLNEIKSHVEKCPEKNVKCEFCGEVVKFKNLDIHKNNSCSIIECPLCRKRIQRNNFQSHLRNVECLQTQIDNLKCELFINLGKRLKNIYQTMKEMRDHEKEKEIEMQKLIEMKVKKEIEAEIKKEIGNNKNYCYTMVGKFVIFIITPFLFFYILGKLIKEKE